MLQRKRIWDEVIDESSQSNVPLKQLNVNAKIRSFAANVTITQVFRNEENVPIEAVYCFPIEEQAAVYGFVARIDDREIIAELKEKNQAQREYDNALQKHHGTYMLEQDEDSQDNFVINVGALPPNKECHITISYVSELELIQNGTKIRFVIPTTIAPRYNPKQGGISSPANTTTEYVQTAPYTIEFHCCVEKYGISGVSSVSHPIQIDFNQKNVYLVEFAQNNIHLDRDIVMDFELAKIRSNTIVAVESKAIMASFTPTEQDCQRWMNDGIVTNEFIFIVDCSGSMDGENKIGLARQAMLLFLKSLPVNCYLNIIRFGSNYKSLFSGMTVIYNEENVRQAEQLINNIKADLGGTELLQPLKWLKENPPIEGRSRQIFLLTDGEVSNVDEVLQLCRSMATSTRIFSFGLGHAPSRSLIKGVARTTNGRFAFIPPHTDVDVYIAEQLQKALQPCITNVQIRFNVDSTLISIIPSRLPPVFINDRLIVYAVVNDDKSTLFDQNVTVELYSEQHCLCEAKVNCIPSVSNDETIARLAAKAHILELQHTKPSQGESQMTMQEIKETIINISLKHNILSPYTAFIGIEKRVNASNTRMVLREVPIQISADNPYLNYFEAKLSQMSHNRNRQTELVHSARHTAHAFNELSHISHMIDGKRRAYENWTYNCKAYDTALRRFSSTLKEYVEDQQHSDSSETSKNVTKTKIEDIHKDFDRVRELLSHIRTQYDTVQQHLNSGSMRRNNTQRKFDHVLENHGYSQARHHFNESIDRYDSLVQNVHRTTDVYEETQKHYDHLLRSFEKDHELQKTFSAEEHQQLSEHYMYEIDSAEERLNNARDDLKHCERERGNVEYDLKYSGELLKHCMNEIGANVQEHERDLDEMCSEIRSTKKLLHEAREKTFSKKSCKIVREYDQKDLDIVRLIILEQKFDGLWNFDMNFIEQLTGKSFSEFQHLTNTATLISAIIVVVLETRFTSLLPMWYGVVQKARKRLLDMLNKDNDKYAVLLENIQKQL